MADLEAASTLREAGNELFKKQEFSEAIKRYTAALESCPKAHQDGAVILKNRAACWLKLGRNEEAISDATAALLLAPSDVKCLYRRAVALEARGEVVEAFRDLQKLLQIDPKNKPATEAARRVAAAMKKKADSMQSTDGIATDMFATISKPGQSEDNLKRAAKNLAILSRESAGAEKIFAGGGVEQLIPFLSSKIPEVVQHILQTFVGLCTEHKSRAYAVIQLLSLETISSLISSPEDGVSRSAVSILEKALLSVTGEDKSTPRNAESAIVASENAVILPVARLLFDLLVHPSLSSAARDCIQELLLQTIPRARLGEMYTREGLIPRLLELAAFTSELGDAIATIQVSDDSRLNVALLLVKLHESYGNDKGLQEVFSKQCATFILPRLSDISRASNINGMTALCSLLQSVLSVGNTIFSEESVLAKMVEMASSDDVNSQIIAAEALVLAASDKDRCHGIMEKGLPVLKELYVSTDDRVRVRSLIGLCKLGSVGGGDVNARAFAAGSTLKLEKACRKFVVSSKKNATLKKWATEGLAFLTMDAEVKEELISDQPALKALMSVPHAMDASLVYGIATIFVNLTNSYDKPEKNAELEELANFAKEKVPKEHDFDAEDYVKKRVAVLLEMGVVSMLVSLAAKESKAVHEQISRVFLALTCEAANRGAVIQQGGAKCLIGLALSGTDKGKLLAAQALAKIGITNDPRLAFPGQRSLEVIRPLLLLLKSDKGLQNFEGLMALTNLASTDEEAIKKRIVKEGGLPLIENLMFEENEMIRRAATETMCNMLVMEEVHQRFYQEDVERVKLWTLFSGEDDPGLAKAASGGLAQISHDPKICEQIMKVSAVMDILKELVARDDEDLRYRALYILANLVAANKEIAEKLVESDFLDIFMAFAQNESCSAKLRETANRGLASALKHGLIQPNPDLEKITK